MSDLLKTYLWIGLGSAIGGMTRFWLSAVVAARWGTLFPWSILVVNVSGSLLIGFLAAIAGADGRLNPQWRTVAVQFLMIGICGGFTTFSSFSLQTLSLLQDRDYLRAAGNVLASVAFCLVAVWLGFRVGDVVNRR